MSDLQTADRIASLDILRGVAVMGIFAMNVVNFAMPNEAYLNPAAYGLEGPADVLAWAAAFVLIDGKMRGLFSFLFGASMLLVIGRAQAKGNDAASTHFARMWWLLVLGLAHAVLIWDGDILVHYAVVGFVAFAFRNGSPRSLVRWSLSLLLVQLVVMSVISISLISAEAAASAPGASAEAIARWAEANENFVAPDAQELAGDYAMHRGGIAGLVAERWDDLPENPIFALALFGLETLAYMIAGMWGLKSGFLTGAWTRARYASWARVCLAVSVPAYVILAALYWASGFDPAYTFGVVLGLTTIVRPIMVLGIAALVILLTADGGALVARLAAAGRAAFSNYLGASLIATTVFYGYGGGWWGYLSRWQLYPLVVVVWALMLLWSQPWLERYRYGPFEWLWRSLSRGEAQAMRR